MAMTGVGAFKGSSIRGNWLMFSGGRPMLPPTIFLKIPPARRLRMMKKSSTPTAARTRLTNA